MATVGDNRDDISPLIAYRLELAEKKLQHLDDKIINLSSGFIEMKVELQHVAKNEGKLSGGISGAVISLGVSLIVLFVQAALKL